MVNMKDAANNEIASSSPSPPSSRRMATRTRKRNMSEALASYGKAIEMCPGGTEERRRSSPTVPPATSWKTSTRWRFVKRPPRWNEAPGFKPALSAALRAYEQMHSVRSRRDRPRVCRQGWNSDDVRKKLQRPSRRRGQRARVSIGAGRGVGLRPAGQAARAQQPHPGAAAGCRGRRVRRNQQMPMLTIKATRSEAKPRRPRTSSCPSACRTRMWLRR